MTSNLLELGQVSIYELVQSSTTPPQCINTSNI